MKARRYFTRTTVALASVVVALLLLVACQTSQPTSQSTSTPMATESKAVSTKDVYVIFEGPWAFAPDPKDANSVIALAPKTKSHRDLVVQRKENTLAAGIYDLSLPTHGGPGAGTVDPNILQMKIDPQSVQHALDSKSARYAIRLPKPDEYMEAIHYRSRAGSTYPPDASTEKDYVTSVSLRYSVTTLTGFSLAGSPDSGTFNPLLLSLKTPIIKFIIEPIRDPDASDKCHTHAREAFRDLTKLVNVTLFVDYPNDPSECHGKDPQNARPVKAEMAPNYPRFFTGVFAGFSRQQLLGAVYFFFGEVHDCEDPGIVGGG
jgi:hypothetical protein